MRLFRKIYNKLFNPFNRGWCRTCNHAEFFHRGYLANSSYPGITCYGYNGFKLNWEKRCRCKIFEAMGNLDYLEYKAKEAGVL